jgi:hypothetical protein
VNDSFQNRQPADMDSGGQKSTGLRPFGRGVEQREEGIGRSGRCSPRLEAKGGAGSRGRAAGDEAQAAAGSVS